MCGLNGVLYQVDLLTGHNNDAGALVITGLKSLLVKTQMKLLGDLGYSHNSIITPDPFQPQQWRNIQKGLRPVVETVIGLVKNWRVTSDTFRGYPELQAMAVMVCYQLTAIRLKDFPLRQEK